jgi:Zn-dependent protease with chaperone function
MADKDKEDRSTRIMYMATATATAFLARKLLIVAWTKVAGKKPPTNPEDPKETLAEALGWSVLVGITVAVVRVLAIRAVSRKAVSSADREPANAADG